MRRYGKKWHGSAQHYAPKRMQSKLRVYVVREGGTKPVLFVVPNEARQASISTWGLAEANNLEKDSTIFWITTKHAVTEETVLSAPIWQVVGGPESLSLESLAAEPVQTFRADSLTSAQSLNGQEGFIL